MAYATNITAPSLLTGLFTRGCSAVEALRVSLRKAADYRHTVKELDKLSTRELDDLGLSRWGIKAAARRSVYGEL